MDATIQTKPTAKSAIRFACQTLFYPLDAIPQDTLWYFKLLHWEGKYFAEKLQETGNGTILREGESFLPIYQRCTPEIAKASAQIKLSFRAPKDPTICPGYVVIRLANDAATNATNATYPKEISE